MPPLVCLFVRHVSRVCLSQFTSYRAEEKEPRVSAAAARPKRPSVGPWTLRGVATRARERRPIRSGPMPAGRETPQQERQRERGRLARSPPETPPEADGRTEGRTAPSGPDTAPAALLRRRSQAVQFPLVQAFPVLEVVVQVLHQVGEVGERCRDATNQTRHDNQ